jgi:F0F1-type ATP synthase assembly protein I
MKDDIVNSIDKIMNSGVEKQIARDVNDTSLESDLYVSQYRRGYISPVLLVCTIILVIIAGIALGYLLYIK